VTVYCWYGCNNKAKKKCSFFNKIKRKINKKKAMCDDVLGDIKVPSSYANATAHT
jgi:hypothetical protein